MQSLALNLAVCARHAALALRVVCGVDAGNIALGILLNAPVIAVLILLLTAGNDIGILQSNFLARAQAHEFLAAVLHKVLSLDIQLTLKPDGVRVTLGNRVTITVTQFGIVYGYHLLDNTHWIIVNNQFHRIYNGTYTQCTCVQILAACSLHQLYVVQRIKRRVAYLVYKVQDSLRAVSAAAYAAYRRHSRIVPTVYHILLGQD